ncbi:MAG: efflux RND transporter periplasmic adaptor subunit [Terracidiphilus sp.]
MSKRNTFLVAMAAAVLTTGCESNSAPPAVAASTTPASSAAPAVAPAPSAQDAKSFTTSGPLVAEQQADVSAEREGRIVEIDVQIGDHVQSGRLLARLDDRLLHAACDAQNARLASAKAQESEWQSEEQTARADLRRADQMRDDKIISEEIWEHAKYRVDETVAEVERYRSDESAAEADLAAANLQLAQSRIVAPFSGVIGRSSVRPDQQVKAGDVLFWITAEAPLHVLFTVPETLMASFTVGRPLELTTADYPGLHQAGRIYRVSPVVDPASGSVQVIGAVDHASPLLKPGMTMQVRLAP